MKKHILTLVTSIILFAFLLSACTNQANEVTPSKQEKVSSDPTVESHDDSSNHANNENRNTSDQSTQIEKEKDLDFIDIKEDSSISVLVNKQHKLAENYAPDDLVTVDVPTVLENPEVNQLRKEAADALKKMFDHANNSGIYLYARSGYRSYQTQVGLFNSYAERHGQEAANRYSARPGESEHQTGLAIDVTSESVDFQLTEKYGDTKEGKWLVDHAHEFGFIIRYPENMEHITGYTYEPWHLRYLGVNLATEVKESNLTYEEFLVEMGFLDEADIKE